jgi:hypothetical protein
MVIYRLIPLTTILFLTTALADELNTTNEPKLLDKLAEPAAAYAKQFIEDKTATFNLDERTQLRITADLLLEHNYCNIALPIAKQIVAGVSMAPANDWLRISQISSCADDTKDAVLAAWLGVNATTSKNQRRDALILLGSALENDSQYGARYAIAAYTEALSYGVSKHIKDKLINLEQILAEEQVLRLDKFYTQKHDTTPPAICLDFSSDMPEVDIQNYGDFIRFDPAFSATFTKHVSDEICVTGANFGTNYHINILPELAATNGSKTNKLLHYEVNIDNQSPKLWFSNSRYILPPGGGVPIHSINAPQAKLTLYKIGERNLINSEVRNMFRSDLSEWRTQQIEADIGEIVWSGIAELATQLNQDTVTNIPIATYTPQQPGIYVLTATPTYEIKPSEYDDDPTATLWLLISDIGITSYQGTDGMILVTRSLTTTKPLQNVHLTLYARNNIALAEVTSDAHGIAKIPVTALEGNGGKEPLILMATATNQDFTFMDISIAPYDLSDRGVTGRTAPGSTDAFLYTERGVYRPGETVYLTALLRDDLGQAIDSGLPLTIRILRSDNQIVTEQVLQQQGLGGYSFKFQLSNNARAGRWNIEAFLDPKAATIGTVGFQVEDVVPPRIEVKVSQTPAIPMKPGDFGAFAIEAQYLFGAPGADLNATGEMSITADSNPFPQFPNYRFGSINEVNDSVISNLTETRTDNTGRATFEIKIDKLPKLERPLIAKLRTEVMDVDGRAVAATYDLPVRHKPVYIGILLPNNDGYVPEQTETKAQIIAVDANGQSLNVDNLHFKLVEEQADYQWYREESQWKFKRQIHDRVLQENTTKIAANIPTMLPLPVTIGSYRLEVREPNSGAFSSTRINIGWSNGEVDASTPDRLIIRSDQKEYKPGDIAKLTVQAPFAGTLSLVLAANTIKSVQNFEIIASEQTLEVPIDTAWGCGVYALVTAYKPDTGKEGQGPRRAVGISWLGLAQNLRQISVNLDAPVQTRPRQTLPITITATKLAANETAFIALAAVDESVLQLTDYQNPDPLKFYFGQRTLGVSLRDLYGNLIDGHQGQAGKIRAGGDNDARRGAPNPHIQIVSLYSGITQLNNQGKATIPLELPDFNGKLRLIAVAWSKDKVGQTTTAMTVRDPVVMLPSTPRFLAVGDVSQISLLLNNLEGAIGDYRINWNTTENLALVDTIPATTTVQLAPGSSHTVIIPLKATSAGNGAVHFQLTMPNGEILTRDAKIGIRSAFLPERQIRFGRLRPGASTRFGRAMIEDFRPETVNGILTVSATPNLDVPSILRQLDLYPHGCLEQIVSKAFPLLYVTRLGEQWNYASQTPITERLLTAITQILEKQQESGGFGLWSNDDYEDAWVSVYALDFLQQAKRNGIAVPDLLWNRGIEWLRYQITTPEVENMQTIATQTYALHLLAANGDNPIETARYLIDNARSKLPSALSAAQLGTALAIMGDTERATQAFTIARNLKRNDKLDDYGSNLRDLAGLLLLSNETKQDSSDLVQALSEEIKNNKWLSTQEQAWIVRAANSLTEEPTLLAVKIQGVTIPERPIPLTRNIPVSILVEGLNLSNIGQTSAWYSLNIEGSPINAPLSMTKELYVQRSMLNLTGEPVEAKAINQGQVMVILLEGNATTYDIKHKALLLDPLPAGLEIENSNLANVTNVTKLQWLGELTTTNYHAALDDRFIAAFDLSSEQKTFKIAYLARAVSPGRYRAPPAWIEDMYRPRYRGRGKSGWIEIKSAK